MIKKNLIVVNPPPLSGARSVIMTKRFEKLFIVADKTLQDIRFLFPLRQVKRNS